MKLFIAILIIVGLDMSPAWYITAIFVWAGSMFFDVLLIQEALKSAIKKLPGIRGVV